MAIRKWVVNLTTNSGGAATGYTGTVRGFVEKVQYRKTDFANGVDFAITGDVSGTSVLALTDQNAAGTWYPRAATHSVAGVASLYAGSGTAVNDRVAIGGERIKVVIAQGGDTKVGAVDVFVSDE